MPAAKISSIRDYVVHYAIVIFIVVFLAAALHYFAYSRYLHDLHQQQHINSLRYSADSVARLLDFYQSVVDKIAQQHVIIDLLQFGDDRDVQQWANDMQRLLPESIGLALFDNNGKVRGERAELRLSDRCYDDMQRRVNGESVARPPVHYKIEQLAHFDIVSPVIVDGERIGLVFASFSLDVIARLLESISYQGHYYQVMAPNNYRIAAAGEEDSLQGERFDIQIPHTDWLLKKYTLASGNHAFVASLLVSNILTFILVSSVLFIAIKRLFNMVVSDFETLTWMMHRIKRDDFDSSDVPQPHLAETQGVVRFIQYAAEELNGYQKKLRQQSNTDELTGLFNRRVLNEKIEYYQQQANKGRNASLVIMDLDYFKLINDSHGHELGDVVLARFAEVLRKNCKKTDVCTRTGGDEFIVILVDYDKDEVQAWYQSLCMDIQAFMQALNREYKIDCKLGVSAGCTSIRVSDNRSALLKRADVALYDVKARGRNDIHCA